MIEVLGLEADAVVLDLDGLLVDSESAAYETARDVFAEHGAHLTRELFATHVGRPADHFYSVLVSHFGLSVAVDDLLRRREDRLARFYAKPTPMRGAIDFVRRTVGRGIAVGVASSSHGTVVTRTVEALGLSPDVGAAVGGGGASGPAPKPAPDVYLAALRQLGVAPRAAIGVEDSSTGAEASVAAGLTTVVIRSEWTRGQRFPPGVLSVGSLVELDVRRRTTG